MDKGTIREIINNYLHRLKNNNIKFEKAYIIGSYAKNTATENSDIDIAFVFKKIDEKNQTSTSIDEAKKRNRFEN